MSVTPWHQRCSVNWSHFNSHIGRQGTVCQASLFWRILSGNFSKICGFRFASVCILLQTFKNRHRSLDASIWTFLFHAFCWFFHASVFVQNPFFLLRPFVHFHRDTSAGISAGGSGSGLAALGLGLQTEKKMSRTRSFVVDFDSFSSHQKWEIDPLNGPTDPQTWVPIITRQLPYKSDGKVHKIITT